MACEGDEPLASFVTRNENLLESLELLTRIPCPVRRKAAIASFSHNWARQDINAAWNAVARSSLSAPEKQLMFNELWG